MDVDAIYRALWRWAEGPTTETPFGTRGSVYREPQVNVSYMTRMATRHVGTAGYFATKND